MNNSWQPQEQYYHHEDEYQPTMHIHKQPVYAPPNVQRRQQHPQRSGQRQPTQTEQLQYWKSMREQKKNEYNSLNYKVIPSHIKLQYTKTMELIDAKIHGLFLNDTGMSDLSSYAPPVMDRPTNDPQYYDGLFHNQTRLDGDASTDRRMMKNEANNTAVDYYIFAPKFENNQDSNGYQDTRRMPASYIKKDQNADGAVSVVLPPHRRGAERNAFPARTAPAPPSVVSHSLQNRRFGSNDNSGKYVSPIRPISNRIDEFNQTIDSMHLPEDMQRPVATRDFVKQSIESSNNVSFGNKNNVSARGAPRLDNDWMADRQMAGDTLMPQMMTASTYENMFY